MSSEKSLTPQIRFKGFTEAWEQRKLGEVFCITMGQSPSSANYTSNSDDYVLVQGNADLQNGWVSPRAWTTQVTKTAEPGTLIMSVRAPVGAMGKTAYKIVLGRGVAGIQGPEILFQLLKKYESEGYWIKKSTGSTFDSINGDELKNTSITLPNLLSEKTEIENLLLRLDSLITLHQRKLDALKKIKSALLEKMFPKDGSNIPEIRFAGYTEAWEQCKLGNLAIFNPNADLPAQFEYVDLESVAGTEMLSHRTELRDSAPSRAQRLAQFGDLFYQTVRPYQKNNYLYEKPDNNYVFSTGYAQMRPLVDGYFLLSLVQNEGFIKKVLDNCSGTSYPAINANVLSSIVVNSSSHRKEQIQIGCLFRRIDNLITLHQRKLDALKKIKSALLEKMFV